MHLVLGATGAFGGAVMRALLARGLPVRALLRDPSRASLPVSVERVAGDARDAAVVDAAARGCATIVHGVGVPFVDWATDLQRVTDNVVSASHAHGTAVVFLGSVHGLKPIFGVPLPIGAPRLDVVDRPMQIGLLRGRLEDGLQLNAELRGVRTVCVRATELLGTGALRSVGAGGMAGHAVRAVLAGGPLPWMGPADAGRSFTDVDDAAEVAVRALLNPLPRPARPKDADPSDPAPTGAWDELNVAGHAFADAAAFAQALASAAGIAPAQVQPIPRWPLRLRAWWDRESRLVSEALHLWDGAWMLDDQATRARFPDWVPSTSAEMLARTVADARAAA